MAAGRSCCRRCQGAAVTPSSDPSTSRSGSSRRRRRELRRRRRATSSVRLTDGARPVRAVVRARRHTRLPWTACSPHFRRAGARGSRRAASRRALPRRRTEESLVIATAERAVVDLIGTTAVVADSSVWLALADLALGSSCAAAPPAVTGGGDQVPCPKRAGTAAACRQSSCAQAARASRCATAARTSGAASGRAGPRSIPASRSQLRSTSRRLPRSTVSRAP